eukprot:2958043-Rhodomonas_salina.2
MNNNDSAKRVFSLSEIECKVFGLLDFCENLIRRMHIRKEICNKDTDSLTEAFKHGAPSLVLRGNDLARRAGHRTGASHTLLQFNSRSEPGKLCHMA